MNSKIVVDATVDAYGLLCPMPIIKVSTACKKLESGMVIELIATDPGVVQDMKDWCTANRHKYLGDEAEGRTIRIWLKKGVDW